MTEARKNSHVVRSWGVTSWGENVEKERDRGRVTPVGEVGDSEKLRQYHANNLQIIGASGVEQKDEEVKEALSAQSANLFHWRRFPSSPGLKQLN